MGRKPKIKAQPKTIDEYLAALSNDKRAALERLRKTIRAVLAVRIGARGRTLSARPLRLALRISSRTAVAGLQPRLYASPSEVTICPPAQALGVVPGRFRYPRNPACRSPP